MNTLTATAAEARGQAALERAAETDQAVPAVFKGALKPLYPLYRSFDLWSQADGLRMSAAMSFYGILSLAPLLVLILAVLGLVLDRSALEANLVSQIGALVGPKGADVIKAAIASAAEPGRGIVASIAAFVMLVIGATGVFAELQSALERLWTQGTGAKAVDAWWHTATLRLRGVAYVLAFGFLMLVSLVISSLLAGLETWASTRFEMKPMLGALNLGIAWLITTALFVALMRMSTGPQPRLRYLVQGAAIGAVLFGMGKYALALYLSTAAVVSSYGAAGSLVVLLMWIYFASAVLLYGASCARVLAERKGEFAVEAKPVPAAAVTAAKGAVRKAGAHDAADSTAAVAAVLSDVASDKPLPTGAAGSGSAPAGTPGARLAAGVKTAEDATARAERMRKWGEVLALAVSVGAAVVLTRPKSEAAPVGDAAKARTRDVQRDLQRAAAPARTKPRRAAAAGGTALMGTALALTRGVRQGLRLAQVAAQHIGPLRSSGRLRTPRAALHWLDRFSQSRVAGAGAQVNQWRERQALSSARRAVERDLQDLRSALRRR